MAPAGFNAVAHSTRPSRVFSGRHDLLGPGHSSSAFLRCREAENFPLTVPPHARGRTVFPVASYSYLPSLLVSCASHPTQKSAPQYPRESIHKLTQFDIFIEHRHANSTLLTSPPKWAWRAHQFSLSLSQVWCKSGNGLFRIRGAGRFAPETDREQLTCQPMYS